MSTLAELVAREQYRWFNETNTPLTDADMDSYLGAPPAVAWAGEYDVDDWTTTGKGPGVPRHDRTIERGPR